MKDQPSLGCTGRNKNRILSNLMSNETLLNLSAVSNKIRRYIKKHNIKIYKTLDNYTSSDIIWLIINF